MWWWWWWCVLHTGYCVALCVAFVSLWPQARLLCGAASPRPLALRFARAAKDLPSLWRQRVFFFPSVFWLSTADWFISAVVTAGVALAALAAVAGSQLALLVAWLVYLSVADALALTHTSDDLLLELGFQCLFLPAPPPLWSWLSASSWTAPASNPAPVVAFGIRLLLFRVLTGAGRAKLRAAMRSKSTAIFHGSAVAQPSPTPLAVWAYRHVPLVLHKAAFVAATLVELAVPVLLFVGPRHWHGVLAGAVLLLQVGKMAFSNGGLFPSLVAVLLLSTLDEGSLRLGSLASLHGVVVHVVYAVLLPGWIYSTVFNAWWNSSWSFWPAEPQGLPFITAYRLLASFRVISSYGWTTPVNPAPVRLEVVLQGSDDGLTWSNIELADDPVCFSPFYLPRLQHRMYMTGLGLGSDSFVSSAFSIDPYSFSPLHGFVDCLAQRVLEGSHAMNAAFADNPFEASTPLFVRAVTYLSRPVPAGATIRPQARGVRAGWERVFLYVHSQPRSMANPKTFWQEIFPEPCGIHWDMMIWRNRVPAVTTLLEAYRRHGNSTEAVLDFCLTDSAAPLDKRVISYVTGAEDEMSIEDVYWSAESDAMDAVPPVQRTGCASADIRFADLNRFWSGFVPKLREQFGNDVRQSANAVSWLHWTQSPTTRSCNRRVLEILTVLMILRLEPLFMRQFTVKNTRRRAPSAAPSVRERPARGPTWDVLGLLGKYLLRLLDWIFDPSFEDAELLHSERRGAGSRRTFNEADFVPDDGADEDEQEGEVVARAVDEEERDVEGKEDDEDEDEEDEDEEDDDEVEQDLLPGPSYFHLGLVAQLLIGRGRSKYDEVLKKPSLAAPLVHALASLEGEVLREALFYCSVFSFDMLMQHANSWLVLSQLVPDGETLDDAGLPGFLSLLPFIAEHMPFAGAPAHALPERVREVLSREEPSAFGDDPVFQRFVPELRKEEDGTVVVVAIKSVE